MDAGTTSVASRIRAELERVTHLRSAATDERLYGAVLSIKRLQARRFRATYADLLSDPSYATAALFFLEELYGERDFSERDAQFGRIASAIEKLFPADVGELAVDLAETHALTESLDHDLANVWNELTRKSPPAIRQTEDVGVLSTRYIAAWRQVGGRPLRERQLDVVMDMGQELQRLTRRRSLRMALRMMRGPAQAAGMGDLQQFLEKGFDAFGSMRDAQPFLQRIHERESIWIDLLFDAPEKDIAIRLAHELAAVGSG